MKKIVSALGLLATVTVALPQQAHAQTQSQYRTTTSRRSAPRLSGRYDLDERRSDNLRLVVSRATQSLPASRRDRVYQNWINRLDEPSTLSIDMHGRSVTIVSSDAPQVTFDADGRDHTEIGPNGNTVTTRAYMNGAQLIVSTSGNRGSDFTVTFTPMADGLQVTRRLDSEYQKTSVSVRSFYRRTAEPEWGVYDGNRRVIAPAGTQIVARLDRSLNSRTVRDGERFTMTIVGGGPLDGAKIDGVVGHVADRPGSASLAFDFDHIWLTNGRSGNFEAQIESVQTPGGEPVRVDQSGVVRDRQRSNSQTVQNGAMGAAVGAIIGAIAGGGKGAAIGAVAGGAGMIVLEGRTLLDLPAGTQITLSSLGAN